MKEKKEDIFHSSTYGKAQSGRVMGSTSSESFADRMRIDKNRKMVSGYNRSNLVRSSIGNGPRAKQYVPPAPESKN